MSAREARDVLGLASDTDPRRLRTAYLSAVKAAHPDKPGGDAERLRTVIEAYDLLRADVPAPASSKPVPKPPRPASAPLEISPAEAMLGGERLLKLDGVGEVSVRLPAGLRVGDLVAVSGIALTISIGPAPGAAIVGDHLCLTVPVERAILAEGGRVNVPAPGGPLRLRVSRQDAARGLVRVSGGGLPARGRHGQGHLYVKLEAIAAAPAETRARDMLRRFTAAWAA